jgi:hypothetical protein
MQNEAARVRQFLDSTFFIPHSACDGPGGILSSGADMSCRSPFLQRREVCGVAAVALLIGVYAGTASAQEVVTQPRPGMPQTQTGPRDPALARDTGAGRISGRVIGGDTGAPLRRAMVTLSGEGLQEGRATTTDEHGRFEFKDLPKGRFGVRANKAGYVSLGFGQRRPDQGGRAVELGDGQTLDRIDFNLPRGGVIGGRIVDEFGEPVAGLQVQVLRYAYREGRRQLTPVGGWGQGTDDRGQYRIYGLSAGEYYVSAQMGMPGMWGGQSDSRSGFGLTYYPGSLNVAEAQRVSVAPGNEQTSINFAVLPTRTVKVSGTVTNSQGRPVTQGVVMLQAGQDTTYFTMSGGGMIKPDGTFDIGNLSPGEYTLHVNTDASPHDEDAEAAVVPISVGMDDLTGLAITTRRATPIAGQLVFDTAASGSLKPAEFMLFARPIEGSMMFGTSAVVKDDWTFELRIQEGPVLIRPARFPEGWTVKAVMANGVDAVDTGIPLRPGQPIEGVQVIVTNRSSGIIGSVTDAAGTPVKDYTVVIFSNDADRWTPTSRYLATARPDQQGRFESNKLPAGNYLIVAVDTIEEGQQSDPEFLQQMRAYATPLQLNDGEKRPVNLRLVALR